MKYRNAKTQGNEAENIIEAWLQLAGYEFKRENTQNGRRKGSVDFTGPRICIDVKKSDGNFEFNFPNSGRDIKWEQLTILNNNNNKLSGLLFTNDCVTFYFVHITDFLLWWTYTSRKHIKPSEIEEIGYKVMSYEDIKRLEEVYVHYIS